VGLLNLPHLSSLPSISSCAGLYRGFPGVGLFFPRLLSLSSDLNSGLVCASDDDVAEFVSGVDADVNLRMPLA